ncbi:MAG: hypothetical protein HW375_39 [Anaerolineales bacterium]|nr:hypothetical protein [Anaerolineales bacterium]
MARYGSADVGFFLVGGYDLLGYQISLNPKKARETEETHTLGDSWVETELTGIRSAEFTQDGFFDDVAGGNNEALVANADERVMMLALEGNTIGKKFIGFAGALQVDYERKASRGALHKASAAYKGSGAVEEGVILHGQTAESATSGNTEGASSVDNGASSANGGSAYLEVPALTLGGFTNFAPKVRHSADDVTYADLVSFTVVTASPAAERKTVAGTVNRHLAISWAYGGAGAGQSATFAIGFMRS